MLIKWWVFCIYSKLFGGKYSFYSPISGKKDEKRCGRDEILSIFILYEADGGMSVARVLIFQLCQGLVENDWLQALVLVDFIKVGQESWLYRQCGYAI